jgi:amino acid transporter
MLSALGAINGMILTGTRIYAVWGSDYPTLAWLGTWNRRTGAPVAAIALQAAIATLLVILVGTQAGRRAFDASLGIFGGAGLPWEQYRGGFNTLIAGSAPVFWLLSLMTCVAIFILRVRHPNIERPFRIPCFPLPALLFGATCTFMLWSSVRYAGWLSLVGFVPLMVGGIAWFALLRDANQKN